jgi:hypothetical protein
MRTRLALGALAASLALALGLGETAHALKQYGAKNYSWLGTGTYYKVGGASNFYGSALGIPGPFITRSRAYGGTQKVVVTRYLYRTNPTNWGELYNTWSLAAPARSTYKLLPRGSRGTRFATWNFAANPYSQYRVVMKVAFYTADGRFLSSIFTDYNGTGDYQCQSDHCSVARGRDGRASIMLMY